MIRKMAEEPRKGRQRHEGILCRRTGPAGCPQRVVERTKRTSRNRLFRMLRESGKRLLLQHLWGRENTASERTGQSGTGYYPHIGGFERTDTFQPYTAGQHSFKRLYGRLRYCTEDTEYPWIGFIGRYADSACTQHISDIYSGISEREIYPANQCCRKQTVIRDCKA